MQTHQNKEEIDGSCSVIACEWNRQCEIGLANWWAIRTFPYPREKEYLQLCLLYENEVHFLCLQRTFNFFFGILEWRAKWKYKIAKRKVSVSLSSCIVFFFFIWLVSHVKWQINWESVYPGGFWKRRWIL